MMRWKLDENVHPAVGSFLRSRRHDVKTVWEQNLRGTSDRNLAGICRAEQRTLLTLDLDFANILSYPPETYAGIVVLRLVNQNRQAAVRLMERAVPSLEQATVEGTLWVIDESGIRVRGMPQWPSLCSVGAIGRARVNVAPWPGELASPSRPPSRTLRSLAIASPSPVPWACLISVGSTW